MNAEVGMRPRFTYKALIDTSSSSNIHKLNVPRGNINPPEKCNPPGDQLSRIIMSVPRVSDPEHEHSSSKDDKQNKKARVRKTVQGKNLNKNFVNKKARTLLEKTTKHQMSK